MKSIRSIQENLIEVFDQLAESKELQLSYLIERGATLPPLEKNVYTDAHLVKGCMSKVWLSAEPINTVLHYKADSNTTITKGLVSLLLQILSGQEAQDIVNADIFFPKAIGMQRFIGTQRSSGFAAMTKQMKMYAWAIASHHALTAS